MNCVLQKRKLRFGDIKLFADGQIVDKGGNSPSFLVLMGFPGGSDSKESACNEGDVSLIPE